MKQLTSILLLFFLFSVLVFSQKTTDSRFSIQVSTGYAPGHKTGATTGALASYQNNKNLFSFSYLETRKYPLNFSEFPKVTAKDYKTSVTTLSLLYGRCFYASNKLYSLSVGPSWNFNNERITQNNNNTLIESRNAGFSFEGAVKKINRKEGSRKTNLSSKNDKPGLVRFNVGFKLFGNLNKWASFVGTGVAVGIDFKKGH